MNFQEDFPSIPSDYSKDYCVLLFYLTSKQDATENCQNVELVGEPLKPEISFNFARKLYWTHCMGEMSVFGWN